MHIGQMMPELIAKSINNHRIVEYFTRNDEFLQINWKKTTICIL